MNKTFQRVEGETLAGLQRRSRRGFLAAAVAAGGMWKWLNDRPEVDGLASPFREADRSLVGIGILIDAAVMMPWLANRKRKLAVVTSSAVLKADAAESALCGYMAWIALAGLVVNAIWNKPWADPVAALALTPLILREAWEAVHSPKLGYASC